MQKLVFIGGVPRSGTTLIQRIIGSHESVLTGQELGLFDGYYRALKNRYLEDKECGRGPLGLGAYFNPLETEIIFKEFVKNVLENLLNKCSQSKHEYFLEKTPSNIIYAKEILETFPNSKFIYIKRNKADNAISIYKCGKSWGKEWVPQGLKGIKGILKIIDQHQLKDSIIQNPNFKKRIYTINYEDFVENASYLNNLRDLFEFIGIITLYNIILLFYIFCLSSIHYIYFIIIIIIIILL